MRTAHPAPALQQPYHAFPSGSQAKDDVSITVPSSSAAASLSQHAQSNNWSPYIAVSSFLIMAVGCAVCLIGSSNENDTQRNAGAIVGLASALVCVCSSTKALQN